jgi:hypothetical protein
MGTSTALSFGALRPLAKSKLPSYYSVRGSPLSTYYSTVYTSGFHSSSAPGMRSSLGVELR